MTVDSTATAHTMNALAWASDMACRRKSCKPEQLCGPCSARAALNMIQMSSPTCPHCGAAVKAVEGDDGNVIVCEPAQTEIYMPSVHPDRKTVWKKKLGHQRHRCGGDHA